MTNDDFVIYLSATRLGMRDAADSYYKGQKYSVDCLRRSLDMLALIDF